MKCPKCGLDLDNWKQYKCTALALSEYKNEKAFCMFVLEGYCIRDCDCRYKEEINHE